MNELGGQLLMKDGDGTVTHVRGTHNYAYCGEAEMAR
jgi:hypothetical protein